VYATTTLAGVSLSDAINTMSDDTFRDQVYPDLIHAASDASYVVHSSGGIGLAAASFAGLLVSEHTGLFGFVEPGYDPTAIAASRVAEVAVVVLLGSFLAARFLARIPMPRW
jgi:hypothetical protein